MEDMPPMKVHMIYPILPPQLDGIGDYSKMLSTSLAKSAAVTIVTSSTVSCDPIDEVEIIPVFDPQHRRSIGRIGNVIAAGQPDWLILQFNQFSYGKWGLNPYLPIEHLARSPVNHTI